MHTDKPLNFYSKNVYSQFGEDGIIEEIIHRLRKLKTTDNWCVEFGAWDGVHLSNTANLIRNHQYSGILIESDKKRYLQLRKNFPQENIQKLNIMIDFDVNSLDEVLSRTNIPNDFDLLSIDIDGADYWIFKDLVKYSPKIVVIEFNPTISNEINFVNDKDLSVNQGSSPKSIVEMASSKGYSLIACTFCNLIFIRSDYCGEVFGDKKGASLSELRTDISKVNTFFICYDGTLKYSKEVEFLWHNFELKDNQMQILPKFFRKFPETFSRPKKLLFRLYIRLKKL